MTFYPTRGLDIAATRMAHELLMMARNGGAAILLISEDLDELLDLSDRLVVSSRGAIVGAFRPGEIDTVDIGLLMTGAKRHEWHDSPASPIPAS